MSVCRELRDHLATEREKGVSFAVAWPSALDAALVLAHDDRDRRDWRSILTANVSIWRDAYHRAPSLAPAVGLLADFDRVPGGIPCDRCGKDIPEHRLRRNATYCSDDCRRAESKTRWGARKVAA